MRSEQCVVKLTTAVVMIRTASIYSALNADPCLESFLQLLSILRRKQLRSKEVRKLAQGELVDHAVGFDFRVSDFRAQTP